LVTPNFNHAFKFLRYIVCWEFHSSVGPNAEFKGVEESDLRKLKTNTDDGLSTYFLEHPKKANRIEIIKLREFLAQKLGLEFRAQS